MCRHKKSLWEIMSCWAFGWFCSGFLVKCRDVITLKQLLCENSSRCWASIVLGVYNQGCYKPLTLSQSRLWYTCMYVSQLLTFIIKSRSAYPLSTLLSLANIPQSSTGVFPHWLLQSLCVMPSNSHWTIVQMHRNPQTSRGLVHFIWPYHSWKKKLTAWNIQYKYSVVSICII